jgi:putative Holliday junction resolvase
MPLFNLTDLRAALARHSRLIGLDPGERTVGVALSDVSLMLASPYGSFKRGKLAAMAAEIKAIAAKEGVGGLVVGLPLGLDGSFGPAAQAAA